MFLGTEFLHTKLGLTFSRQRLTDDSTLPALTQVSFMADSSTHAYTKGEEDLP